MTTVHQDPDLELSLAACAENLAIVRHALGGVADVLGLHPEVLDDIRLAVSEACANVIVHAYPGRSDGLLVVQVTAAEDALRIIVRDSGTGMAPRADSPGLGVGLPLMASLAQTVELTAAPGGGTEVALTFDLQRQADELADDVEHGATGTDT